MKVYLCFLRNGAVNSKVDSQFLGVASSELSAIDLCIKAIATRAYVKCSRYSNIESKSYGRFQEYIQQEKSKIDEAIELLMAKNISDRDTLNAELQFLFKKIGVAKRWCEIKEIEIDEPTYFD